MKIAITSLYLPSGSKIGVGYQVHALANALVVRGHRVTVFSQSGAPEGARYETQVIPVRRRLRTFGFAWDLRRVDFSRFDVLNAHGDDWFLWGVRRPRHVHTYHGSCLAEMLHVHGIKEKARMGVLAACETGAGLLCDETVAVSENTRRYVPGIRHVIPCGVDLGRFSPGDVAKSADPSVLFVGTMHGRKRGRMLLEAFRREIRPRVPTAQLWCVCERPAGEPDEPGVRWTGRIPESELIDLYRRAWAFCLPSTYEGFGVPYIEAMAAGTPVVATANPGAIEVTASGGCGVIAADADLGAALLKVIETQSLREHLRDAGLRRSLRYGWDQICARYEALFWPAPETTGVPAGARTVSPAALPARQP